MAPSTSQGGADDQNAGSPAANAQPSTQSKPLDRHFCLTPGALSAWLRQSRAFLDDPIAEHLAALSSPSSKPFTPTPGRQSSTDTLPPASCTHFITRGLLPTWAGRAGVLGFCHHIAQQDDPDDPDRERRELALQRQQADSTVQPRLDPYAAVETVPMTRREKLEQTVQDELTIEGIVRRRTWDVVASRCPDMPPRWEQAVSIANGLMNGPRDPPN